MIAFINIFHTLCYRVKRITIQCICHVEPAVIQEILEERNKCGGLGSSRRYYWRNQGKWLHGEIRTSVKTSIGPEEKTLPRFCPLLVELSNYKQDLRCHRQPQ